MTCRKCEEEISIKEAEVTEVNDKIDIQIRCRKCGTNHFTYIQVDELVDDK